MPLPNLLKVEQRPLNPKEEALFNDYAFAEASDPQVYNPKMLGQFRERELYLLRVLDKHELPVSVGLVKFLAVLCGAQTSRVLLWAFTLKAVYAAKKRTYLDLYTYIDIFPEVMVPTDLAYELLWETLKNPNGGPHLLDQPQSWSI